MSVSTRLAVLRTHRALGAQSSTLPPAVRRPCTHGDIGRVLHQPWLSRARLMMPPQVAMLSVQRGRLSALSDVRRRLGQHSAGRTAAKLVVRARACFQRSEACWCISLAGWASERLRCGPFWPYEAARSSPPSALKSRDTRAIRAAVPRRRTMSCGVG